MGAGMAVALLPHSTCLCFRVGNELGAGMAVAAQRSALVSIMAGTAFMSLTAALLLLAR